ncbi:MAG: c-type cytochrome [Acidobacteriota bacterium]
MRNPAVACVWSSSALWRVVASDRSKLGALALAALLSAACQNEGEKTAALYQDHCASCHGSDGRGDPRRTALEPNLDLTRSELVTSGSRGAVYRAISGGFGTMPGFAHRLAHPQIDAITGLVMDFGKPPTDD